MKKCPYCGKEYPDDATVCVMDGESLSGPAIDRKKINGVWRGAYGFDTHEGQAGRKVVPFTLRLEQGWMGHFTGLVNEDPPNGMPGNGTIDGYFGFPRIDFKKQMPICYVATPDGRMMTLREQLLAEGQPCERDVPHPLIAYEGEFLNVNRAQGTWIIRPVSVRIPGGGSVSMSQVSGVWCMEFITADVKGVVTGGPTEPLFDKALLPQPESLTAAELQGFRSLGKFSVANAEWLLKRLEEEGLRFEINRDDTAMRQMMPITEVMGGYSGMAPMIEIFVYSDDEARAVEIMGEDNKV